MISVCSRNQLILWLASGASNEGPRSEGLGARAAVSWPWVPAWGSLEPPRRDGENAQRTGKNGGKLARYGLRSVNKEGTGGITWVGLGAWGLGLGLGLGGLGGFGALCRPSPPPARTCRVNVATSSSATGVLRQVLLGQLAAHRRRLPLRQQRHQQRPDHPSAQGQVPERPGLLQRRPDGDGGRGQQERAAAHAARRVRPPRLGPTHAVLTPDCSVHCTVFTSPHYVCIHHPTTEPLDIGLGSEPGGLLLRGRSAGTPTGWRRGRSST